MEYAGNLRRCVELLQGGHHSSCSATLVHHCVVGKVKNIVHKPRPASSKFANTIGLSVTSTRGATAIPTSPTTTQLGDDHDAALSVETNDDGSLGAEEQVRGQQEQGHQMLHTVDLGIP